MKLAFLHQPNDPYSEVRINYFISKGFDVYSITFPKKSKQRFMSMKLRGIDEYKFSHQELSNLIDKALSN